MIKMNSALDTFPQFPCKPFPWYVSTEEGRMYRLMAYGAGDKIVKYRSDAFNHEIMAQFDITGSLLAFDLTDSSVAEDFSLPPTLKEVSYVEWKENCGEGVPSQYIVDVAGWEGLTIHYDWKIKEKGYNRGATVKHGGQVYQSICNYNASDPTSAPTLWIKLSTYGYIEPEKEEPVTEFEDMLADLRQQVDNFRLN